MIHPSDLERYPKQMEMILRQLETNIMKDIVERINTGCEITRTADWQIYRLKAIKQSDESTKKQIQNALNLTDAQIDKIYSDVIEKGYSRYSGLYKKAGKDFTPYEDNKWLQRLIESVKKQTSNEIRNITQTTGFIQNVGGRKIFLPSSAILQDSLDNGVMEVMSGTYSKDKAIRDIVNTMTRAGLTTVDYATGLKTNVVSACRRALMTGVNQAVGKIQEHNASELGTDKYEVSWHGTARPDHQVWQGRVYTMQELISICGLGTASGLCGANCRHTYYPFLEGISERMYTDEELDEMNTKENEKHSFCGKLYNAYEATQRMRKMESDMRMIRQRIKLLKDTGNDEAILNYQCRYQGISQEYARFAKEMKLPQERERIYVDGLGRFPKLSVANHSKNDIMNLKSNILKDSIDNGSVKLAVNKNKQERHIKDSKGYIKGRSYVYGSIEDMQKLVDDLHGTGELVYKPNGEWKKKEKVLTDRIIGVDVDCITGKETETSKATIHYSKTGTHVVPRKE